VTLATLADTNGPRQPVKESFVAHGGLSDLLTAVGSRRDGAAFTALFDHFAPRVHAHMVRLGLAPMAADDLTQEVMETVWCKAHLYDPCKSAPVTWIYRIARNRRIDVGRRSREWKPAPDISILDIADCSAASDERLDGARRKRCVLAALDGLPRDQYTLVRLAFFEGLTHSAIARQQNLPLGTVKSRLRLAFARLRRLLNDAGVTEA